MSQSFAALQDAARSGGADAALVALADQLRSEQKHHELFEALKMRVRLRLGLPLFPGDTGAHDLPEEKRTALEDGLIDACRDVGSLLLAQGKIREGWMYLRPVGDKTQAASILAKIECDDDNYQDLVEVLLHEGVDVGRGYSLLLQHNGVCNAITTFDQMMHQRPKVDRQAAAGALLDRLYDDLTANVRHDIQKQEGKPATQSTLEGLLADRDYLLNDGAYHIDTTHLSAVVRFARVLDRREQWEKAYDLTTYGRRLSTPLQYQGDEPFLDNFPAHGLYFGALLGKNVAEAVEYFANKAKLIDPQFHGTQPIEVYVELLDRLGRSREALDEAIALMPESASSVAYAPLLVHLCGKAGEYDRALAFCERRGDALGYAATLAEREAARALAAT